MENIYIFSGYTASHTEAQQKGYIPGICVLAYKSVQQVTGDPVKRPPIS